MKSLDRRLNALEGSPTDDLSPELRRWLGLDPPIENEVRGTFDPETVLASDMSVEMKRWLLQGTHVQERCP